MDEQDMIQLLRYYQHDLLNELQIIQGYASIGKIETVKEKVEECVSLYQQERKLLHLNIPKFTIWLMRVVHEHQHICISYDIQLDQTDISCSDHMFLNVSQSIIRHINEYGSDLELHEIHIKIGHGTRPHSVILTWHVEGALKDIANLQNTLNDIDSKALLDLQVCSNKISCEFLYA